MVLYDCKLLFIGLQNIWIYMYIYICHVNRIRPRSTIHSTAARSRAFSLQAPIAWNSLSATLRAERNSEKFKNNLKTYLFTL